MAKKTNKTNHVLNLLAGNGEAEEENVKQSEKPEKDAETNVQIVAPNGEDEEIAEAVNRLLDQELEAEMRGPEAVAEEMPEPEAAAEEAEMPEAETAAEEAEEPEAETAAEEEPEAAAEEAEEPEPEAAAEEAEMPEPEAAAEEAEEPEPEAVAEEEPEPEAVAEESDMIRDVPPNYVFVNVMEYLVREKIRNYMEEFGNCTCSRCVADATAVALTNLPAKYVVVNRDAKAPLMNFYAQRYAGQIMVEITKGCIRVKEHPHHDRD